MRRPATVAALTALAAGLAPSAPPAPTKLGDVAFPDGIKEDEHLSAAAVVGDFLLVTSDEVKPGVVQVLKKDGGGYKLAGEVKLPAGEKEIDLEGLAADGDTVYATGSHSWTRKVGGGVIGAPDRKKAREQVFRFRLKPDGTAGPVDGPKSVLPAIEAHPVLKGFVGVAGKENGIDIEGLAAKDGRLYFGFRGPVLRDNWVPVLSCTWDDPAGTAKVAYLQLDGRGVRDLAAVPGGVLVLAGPVGDGDSTYRVYFWDGTDGLAPKAARPKLLAEFPDLGKGKPEGLAVLGAAGNTYDVLLVCDGLPKGGPTRWKIAGP